MNKIVTKIGRVNGKLLGAAIFLSADVIEALSVGDQNHITFSISVNRNDIILTAEVENEDGKPAPIRSATGDAIPRGSNREQKYYEQDNIVDIPAHGGTL